LEPPGKQGTPGNAGQKKLGVEFRPPGLCPVFNETGILFLFQHVWCTFWGFGEGVE